MNSKEDAAHQHLLQLISKDAFNALCPGGYTLHLICVNTNCGSTAGLCNQMYCKHCATKHSQCEFIRMTSLIGMIKKPSSPPHWLANQIAKLADACKQIQSRVEAFQSEICLGLLEPTETNFVRSLFSR